MQFHAGLGQFVTVSKATILICSSTENLYTFNETQKYGERCEMERISSNPRPSSENSLFFFSFLDVTTNQLFRVLEFGRNVEMLE